MKYLTITLFAAVAMMAQPPGMGAGPGATPSFTEVKAALGLSDAQVTSLQGIQTAQRQAAQPIAQQMQTKQAALRAALTAGTTAVAAGTTLLEIEALRKQLDTLETNARNQAAGVLSADQRTKLKALEDAAKLQPAIGQATSLGLIVRATNTTTGVGPRGMMMQGRGGGPPWMRQ